MGNSYIINAATSAEMYANVHELSALLKELDFTHDERRKFIRFNMAIYATCTRACRCTGCGVELPRPPDDGAPVTRRNAPPGVAENQNRQHQKAF